MNYLTYLKKTSTLSNAIISLLIIIVSIGLLGQSIKTQSDTTIVWLYAFDVAAVISCSIMYSFLGFSGVFAVILFSSSLITLGWIYSFNRFYINCESVSFEVGPIFKISGFDGNISILIDNVSYSFSMLTSLISFCVLMYAFSYMRFERNILNFIVYYKLFGWSMILLVLSNSWFCLILGWELIGITSFLLINFWSTKITTLKSAIKAFTFNKVSDAALILCACLSLSLGFYNINSTMSAAPTFANLHINLLGNSYSYASILLTFLVIASFCKSAQFGFHFWLPDSMEAPVPASALIHSATLVSAGIYLLLRFNYLFLLCSGISDVYCVITAFTAFYGAIIASYQTDVKKILAYSTISHCGLLMFSVVMHSPFITIFYLLAHGFFKSLNFICVGNFIQYSNNYQDVSKMGRYFNLFRFEFFFFFITLFNLSSAPMFFCFFSKHWLLNQATSNGYLNLVCASFLFLAAFCGFFYSSKLLYECCLSIKRSHYTLYNVNNINRGPLVLFKRSNILSRLSMVSLLTAAVFVLYMAWSPMLVDHQYLMDGYNSGLKKSHGSLFYAINLYFSVILAIIAMCYLIFKKESIYTKTFYLTGFLFCLICAII